MIAMNHDYEHCDNSDHKFDKGTVLDTILEVSDHNTITVAYGVANREDYDHLCLKHFNIDEMIELIKSRKIDIDPFVSVCDFGNNPQDLDSILEKIAKGIGYKTGDYKGQKILELVI